MSLDVVELLTVKHVNSRSRRRPRIGSRSEESYLTRRKEKYLFVDDGQE